LPDVAVGEKLPKIDAVVPDAENPVPLYDQEYVVAFANALIEYTIPDCP
jgi:hypothetical protein